MSMHLDSIFIHKMNRYSERGSPYLIPLNGRKEGVGEPLNKIEIDEVETWDIISFMRVGEKFR